MGQSSSQVQQEEDVDQPSTDRFTPFDSTAEKEITPEGKIGSDVLTQIPTQSTNKQKPDPFLTPKPKRRFSFEIRVPSPADLKMARPSDVPMSEPANPAKRKRIWEDNDDEATPPPSAQRVKIKDRLSINNLIEDRVNGKDGSGNVAYTQGSTPTQTPDGKPVKPKSKRTKRGKTQPPGFRPGHISPSNAMRTGLFSPEEIEILEQHKLWFCNKHHITADMFDASVQSVQSAKNGIFLEERPIVTYKDFWKDIYDTIPIRDKKSIRRFCRRHFSNAYKPHQWTESDDDELERLQAIYGTKWANIARDMERTYDDVVQRWKNKVELRHTMKLGPWDDDEIYKLIGCVEETRKQLLRNGKTEEDIGKDIYELPDEEIGWGNICKRFQGTRSRQQLADKWRKVKRIVLKRRKEGYEDAVWDPSLQPRPGPRSKYRPLPIQSGRGNFISNETVDSSDEGEDQNSGQHEKEQENGNKERPTKANGTAQPEVNESSDSSSSDEENDAAENGEKDENEVVDESAGDETPRPKTNGYHEASDNESVVPESQVDESQAEESQASSSRSPSPEAETNGHTASGRQPSEELGVDPVSAQEAPETDKDTQGSEEEEGSENADEDIKSPTSQSKPAKPIKSSIIKQEERHSSPSNSSSDSESDSDDESRDGSSSGSSDDDESDEESEEELSPEEIEKKIFKFKKEPEDD